MRSSSVRFARRRFAGAWPSPGDLGSGGGGAGAAPPPDPVLGVPPLTMPSSAPPITNANVDPPSLFVFLPFLEREPARGFVSKRH